MRFTHPLRGPSFGRRVLSATELPQAAARTGRSHLPVLKNEGYFLAERGRLCVSRIPFGDRPSDVVSYRPPNSRGLPPVPVVLLIFRASGGEGEIRTPGTDKRYNRFRVCRIRPLCHLSIKCVGSGLSHLSPEIC